MSEFSIEESFLRHASNIAEQYKIEKGDYPRSIEEAVALTIKADGSLGKNASAFMVKYTIADLDYEKRKEYCFFILRKKMIKNNKPMYLVSYRGGYIEWIGLDDLQEVVNILDQKLSQQGTK